MTQLVMTTAFVLGSAACGSDAPESGSLSKRPAPTTSSLSSPADTKTPGSGSGTSAPVVPAFDGTVVNVEFVAGEVRTAKKRVVVPAGSKVRIVVTSDVADEVHLHGVDKYVELTPGKPVPYDFTADIPGTFEVELHQAGDLLFTLQVQP